MSAGKRERGMAKAVIGESTYSRFKRLIDDLKHDDLQKRFMSRIISKFSQLHDLELRDILQECHDAVLKGDTHGQ